MVVVDAIIQKLSDQVFTALMDQSQFSLDFQSQFEVMKTQLDILRAFLDDTDNLKKKKETLKACLIKLRELLYEADDKVTDCMIRYEYQKDGSCYRCSASEWFFKYQMGKNLKDINSRMGKMEKNLSAYLTPHQLIHQQGDNTCPAWTNTFQFFHSTEIIGLENDLKKLKGWIFSQSRILQRIAIVGMGGIGKTTIAKKLFDDEDVAGSFEHMIWVDVSQEFSEDMIIKNMLEQLGRCPSGCHVAQMFSILNEVLQDKNCLLVLNDVWKIDIRWWSMLCTSLQRHTDKSSVIIITRNEDVAALMGVEPFLIHRPKLLNDQESWLLFCKFAFSASNGICYNPQFEELGRNILRKCGGLALAIKTTAGLLATKAHNPNEWKKVDEDFHMLTYRGFFSSAMASLQLSYDGLPMHLKQILLCFSIYPEDLEIQAEQLVHWWVGEGLVKQNRRFRTGIDLGYEYLMDLVNRSLIEVVQQRGYDGRVYSCKIHRMVHDLIVTIAENEAVCHFDERGRQVLTPDSCWLGFRTEMNFKSLKHCSKLRALLMMSSNTVIFESNMVLLNSLRVLDLSLIKLDDISLENLMKWIVLLKRLAYLNLSGAAGLKIVPSSIQKLRNLQYFVLAGCINLVEVHPSLTYLRKLVVLDLHSCGLQYLPRGIGMLSQLQELSGFRIARQSNTQSCHLLELQELVQLRVLRMNLSNESEISENEFHVLTNIEKLKVLAIDMEDCTNINVLRMVNQLCPPPGLQELYLRGYRHEILPQWINPEKLSSLVYLCIENGDIIQLPTNPNEGIMFWNLEGLCLKFLPMLKEDWGDLLANMPLLHYVEVSRCFKCSNFPVHVDGHGVWRRLMT